MLKYVAMSVVMLTASTAFADSQSACQHGAYGAISNVRPSAVAPSSNAAITAPRNAAPAGLQTGMKMPQSTGRNTYQSFSYEPGQTTVAPSRPVYRSAPMSRQSTTSFYDSVRGDRKVRGF